MTLFAFSHYVTISRKLILAIFMFCQSHSRAVELHIRMLVIICSPITAILIFSKTTPALLKWTNTDIEIILQTEKYKSTNHRIEVSFSKLEHASILLFHAFCVFLLILRDKLMKVIWIPGMQINIFLEYALSPRTSGVSCSPASNN